MKNMSTERFYGALMALFGLLILRIEPCTAIIFLIAGTSVAFAKDNG